MRSNSIINLCGGVVGWSTSRSGRGGARLAGCVDVVPWGEPGVLASGRPSRLGRVGFGAWAGQAALGRMCRRSRRTRAGVSLSGETGLSHGRRRSAASGAFDRSDGPGQPYPLGHDDAMKRDAAGNAVVEAGWQAVRDDGRVRPELLEAAYAEPRLRQLFPWTGMGELHFSRCTGQRWTWDILYIQPASDGTYWVSGPLRSETVGPAATAQDAIAMVVQHLPAGCGPAFVGTPEELAAHEATTQ